jgi:hypothetical protein
VITFEERLFLDSLGLGSLENTMDMLSGSIMVQPAGDGEHAVVRWIVEKQVTVTAVECALRESQVETHTPKNGKKKS